MFIICINIISDDDYHLKLNWTGGTMISDLISWSIQIEM
jgi:hypothetical protein